MAEEELKQLVRIADTDVNGNMPVYMALVKIKGISFMFSNMVCSATSIDKNRKVGSLSDDEIKKIESVISDPLKFNVPEWMLNRRKDIETGQSKHIVTGNLKFIQENDVRMMKKIRSYKGVRHSSGLPVRGQKTRSNFRKNKGKVSLGVKLRPGAKPGKV